MAHLLGGETAPSAAREYGRTRLFVDRPEPLFVGLEPRLPCWMSHGDAVIQLPPGFVALAHTDSGAVAAAGDPERRLYGLQFHPEVSHTPWGGEVLRAFLYEVCGCRPTWTMASFIERSVEEIRGAVGSGRAIVALSGGVDSATAAALVHRAIGDRLTCIFVDHGLLRQGGGAAGRGGAGGGPLPRRLPHPARARGRPGALPRPAAWHHGSRNETARHRRGVHPGL